jgi:cell wall-associated NlpC family hydrolase
MMVPNYRADMRDSAHAGELLVAAETLLVPVEGEPAAGHVVLFRLQRALAPKRCGIMVGTNRFIHAQERLGVVEANMSEGWRRRVAATFAFPNIEA